jgi:hypothetical protein
MPITAKCAAKFAIVSTRLSASVLVSVSATAVYGSSAHRGLHDEGNWLRHPVVNHDRPTDYDFAPPYPAYPFPLDIGKSWSMRVNTTNL